MRDAEMETGDRRAQVKKELQAGIVKAGPEIGQILRRRSQPEFLVPWGEAFPRALQDGGVGFQRVMDDEVQIEGPVGPGAHRADVGTDLVRRVYGGTQRPQTARIAHRRGKCRRRRSGHRGLDDRVIDPQQGHQAPIRPHARLPRSRKLGDERARCNACIPGGHPAQDGVLWGGDPWRAIRLASPATPSARGARFPRRRRARCRSRPAPRPG